MELQKRFAARKARISDLINGKFAPEQKCVITSYAMKVSRARLVGVVVGKFVSEDKSYSSITIDDGTETIRSKAFGSTKIFENIEIGDSIEIVGKTREYNGEIYITPEIAKKIDVNAEMLTRLEILKNCLEWKNKIEIIKKNKGKDIEELKVSLKNPSDEIDSVLEFLKIPVQPKDQSRETVMKIINDMDKGGGVRYADIFEKSDLPEKTVESVVGNLLEEGICYEPRPGILKKS